MVQGGMPYYKELLKFISKYITMISSSSSASHSSPGESAYSNIKNDLGVKEENFIPEMPSIPLSNQARQRNPGGNRHNP